jgi:competence protein ComEC
MAARFAVLMGVKTQVEVRPAGEGRAAATWKAAPALLPAAALLGGVALGVHLGLPWMGLAPAATMALAALGLALGGPCGRGVAWLAVGLAVVLLRADELPGAAVPEEEKPVTALVTALGPWQRGDFGWSGPARVLSLTQGTGADLVVYRWPRNLWLQLPEASDPPPVGRLRLRGFVRQGSGFFNQPTQPPGRWRLRVKSYRLLEVDRPAGPVARGAKGLQLRMELALSEAQQAVPEDGRAGDGIPWVRALVLGDASQLPPATVRSLRRWGVGHLLAVSGLHVAAVAAVALILLSWLPRGPRLVLALVPVALYLLLVGPRPSLLRAALMALAMVAALVIRRPPVAVNALACFVLAVVVSAPALIFDVSFQLTVSATASLILLAPALARRWRRVPPFLAQPLAATVAAQIATLPFALPVFHLWAPAAPVANLLVVPWAGVLLLLCLGWALLAALAPGLAGALLPVLDAWSMPARWLEVVPPHPIWLQPSVLGSWGALVLALVLLVVAWWPRRFWPLTVVVLGVAFLGGSFLPNSAVREPQALMLDVGQGEALVLRHGRRAVLVDGGGWRSDGLGQRVLLPALVGRGIRRLDAVVLTHDDRDHCGGLEELVDYLPVGELWLDQRWLGKPCPDALVRRTSLRQVTVGAIRELGQWRLEVLASGLEEGTTDLDGNDDSLVLRAVLAGKSGERCLLLTGDIEAPAERRLVAESPEALRCDLLKVAHHGSKTSTTEAFLRAVAPRRAWISAGRGNSYGHPAYPILRRLERQRIQILRTDLHGQVQIRFPPTGGWWVETLAAPGMEVGR